MKQVAGATAQTFTLPSELGNFAVNLLTYVLPGTDPSPVDCPYGGTYDYTLSNDPFGVNDTMDVTFHDCIQGTATDQTKVNGSYTLTGYADSDLTSLQVQVSKYAQLLKLVRNPYGNRLVDILDVTQGV